MTLQPGEIVLARIRFHQSTGAKVRPAVVLIDSGDDDYVAAPITSQPRASDYDMPVQNWSASGLVVPSIIRIHKMSVLYKPDIARRLGRLPQQDLQALADILQRVFALGR